jgi:hypothetical protein
LTTNLYNLQILEIMFAEYLKLLYWRIHIIVSLVRTASDLEQGQPVRMHMDPEGYQQIQDYIAKAG